MMAVHPHLPLKLTASRKSPFLYPYYVHTVSYKAQLGFLRVELNLLCSSYRATLCSALPSRTSDDPRVSMCSRLGTTLFRNRSTGTSLVAQWLRIHLPMQGTRVRALVREDPTCLGATKPVRHNYWACALEPVSHNYWAHTPQQEKPAQWEVQQSHCNKE